MPFPIKRVAVIGTGPSGIAAVRALSQEGTFTTIRVFERRHAVGGTWLYDPDPDVFPSLENSQPLPQQQLLPSTFPALTTPRPEDPSYRTGIYASLDSNVGAEVMSFTHTPFPLEFSAESISKYGPNNPTRPWKTVANYLEDIFAPFLHLVSFNTNVEKVAKEGDEWIITLRRSGVIYKGNSKDYWWQERFDAVVLASGHYNVPNLPDIQGLGEVARIWPGKFEHSKFFRDRDSYVGKKIIIVGGSISAGDLVDDLYKIVSGPLYLSQRGVLEALEKAFHLPNVIRKPQIKCLSPESGGTVEFTDGSRVTNFDKIIFATGYKLSYPFLPGNPVTSENRLSGFYQHIFQIEDSTLTVVGQVKAGLSFRVYEYQAVAVSRCLAGRSKPLPDIQTQKTWEQQRIVQKGARTSFHEIQPDFAEYFNWLRDFAGPPAEGTTAAELPEFQDEWPAKGFQVLGLRDKYWASLGGIPPAPVEKAKL